MKRAEAAEFVRQTFPSGVDPASVQGSVSDELFIQLLDALESGVPYRTGALRHSAPAFFFAGCLRFDRWIVPTPYTVSVASAAVLERFVSALERSDPGSSDNTARFRADQAKTRIYDVLNWATVDAIRGSGQILSEIRSHLRTLKCTRPDKASELAAIVEECVAVIDAAFAGKLRTVVVTAVPVIPVAMPTLVRSSWHGVAIDIACNPHPQVPKLSFVQSPNPAHSVLPSQWEAGFTDVTVTVTGLVDPSLTGPELSVFTQAEHAPPVRGWPQIFVDVFEMVDRMIWGLRLSQAAGATSGRWLLEPNDFLQIEWSAFASDRRVGYIVKASPALMLRIAPPHGATHSDVSLDLSETIASYRRSRLLGERALQRGAANEALFWLNVGIEALLEERSKALCAAAGKAALFDEMQSAKSYWDRAEEVLSEQEPEMAGRVRWPTADQNIPSWYARLRYLAKHLYLAVDARTLLSHFNAINRHRNALFHGTFTGKVEIEAASNALKSFDWIAENFK